MGQVLVIIKIDGFPQVEQNLSPKEAEDEVRTVSYLGQLGVVDLEYVVVVSRLTQEVER